MKTGTAWRGSQVTDPGSANEGLALASLSFAGPKSLFMEISLGVGRTFGAELQKKPVEHGE